MTSAPSARPHSDGPPLTSFAADRTRRSAETDRWLASLLGAEPGVALVAVGGYGRRELLPGSDLDVVFVYDDGQDGDAQDKNRAQEVYATFVRKLMTWLTLRTAAGEFFDIDTALRPNGNSGLLVTSIESYER